MIYTRQQVDRFWNNVNVGPSGQCWLWQRSMHTSGYGQVGLHVDGKDRVFKAHRVAWEIHNNQRLNANVRARHSCGIRLCCNPLHVIVEPDHLLRSDVPQARGERHGRAKLTDRNARLIKYRLNGITTRDVANMFRVGYHTVWDIRNGITWRHI